MEFGTCCREWQRRSDSFACVHSFDGGGVGEKRAPAYRAAGTRAQPRVHALRVEAVPAPRQRLHPLALRELAEAYRALRRVVLATRGRRRRTTVRRHGQAGYRGSVEAWHRGGGTGRRSGRRGGVGEGAGKRPVLVVAAARPAEVDADAHEEDEDGEERREQRHAAAAAAHGEAAVVHVAVAPPQRLRRLLRCHAVPLPLLHRFLLCRGGTKLSARALAAGLAARRHGLRGFPGPAMLRTASPVCAHQIKYSSGRPVRAIRVMGGGFKLSRRPDLAPKVAISSYRFDECHIPGKNSMWQRLSGRWRSWRVGLERDPKEN